MPCIAEWTRLFEIAKEIATDVSTRQGSSEESGSDSRREGIRLPFRGRKEGSSASLQFRPKHRTISRIGGNQFRGVLIYHDSYSIMWDGKEAPSYQSLQQIL